MAFLLVSVSRVRSALRIDEGESDDLLAFYISAASRVIVRYLKSRASEFLAIDSPPNSPPDDLANVPEDIAMAVILLTGYFYKEPDGDGDRAFQDSNIGAADPYLPFPVRTLLHPYRDPTMA